MNRIETQGGSTSAVGAMRQQAVVGLFLMSGVLSLPSATSAVISPLGSRLLLPLMQTSSGIPVPRSKDSASAILELRRLSGLAWDQLARLFDVDRRSLHFWANGKPLSPRNEERLQRLLGTLRGLDRGRARENRSLLLAAQPDGTIPFDLLVEGQYEKVLELLRRGAGQGRVKTPPLAGSAGEGRKPRPPAEHVGALQDRVHQTPGRLLSATPIRTKRK